MTLGVRGALFDPEGQVFLVRHSYVPGWYLPGGGVDPGETIEQAFAREMSEEGGFVIEGPPELFGLYLNRGLSRRDHVALYVSRRWRVENPPKLPNLEIVESGFFPVDALPEGATAATRRRLAEIAGAERSPDW